MERKKRASALDETYVKLYNEIFEKEKNKSKISLRKKIKNLMMTQCYISLLVVFTILALFFDDFRHLVAFRSTDDIFYGITVGIILFFIIGEASANPRHHSAGHHRAELPDQPHFLHRPGFGAESDLRHRLDLPELFLRLLRVYAVRAALDFELHRDQHDRFLFVY